MGQPQDACELSCLSLVIRFTIPAVTHLHILSSSPLSPLHWSMYSDHNVPSATMSFGLIIFDPSGATNVFLFLITQPQLLPLTTPVNVCRSRRTNVPSEHRPGVTPNLVQCERSPGATRMGLGEDLEKRSWNDGSRNGGASSRVDSSQRADVI